jgi:hypothetical protein
MRLAVLGFALVACGGDDTANIKPPASDASTSEGGGDSANVGEAGTDASVPLEYSAYHLPGVYDRIQVFGKDTSRNLCFKIQLVNPSGTTGGLILPMGGWGLEYAQVTHDAAACVSAYTGSADTSMPDSQTGSVSWTGSSPTTLDVDATLKWLAPPAWVNSSEHLKATGVPVN